ncbi:MAG TPA: hypothetical protein ENK25_00255, partial [Bacteroidetes bacterium]|nr:hypothetical protein [Bacteroidota bacterium]
MYRDYRGVPIGLKPVIIRMKVQRLYCEDCGITRQEEIRIADKKKVTPMDMWLAYITAATEYYPQVPIVFDRFHIIEKNLNKAITDLRKAVYREEVDLNKKKLIKGTRWLLLKNR